nr:hypothetical protein [Pseudonocardia sp. ICBG162]
MSRRAVVVRAGWIARRVHLPALVASPLIDEVVVVDVDPAASTQAAAELNVPVSRSVARPAGPSTAPTSSWCAPRRTAMPTWRSRR